MILYSRSGRNTTVHMIELRTGEKREISIDFTSAADREGTTVSSVTWSVAEGQDVVTVSGESLTSNVATALIAIDDEWDGHASISVKATMADTQIIYEIIDIEVI